MPEKPRKKRILVIDDEVSFTWLLKLNLEDAGEYEVAVENEPKNAVQTARKFAPDLIVLDLVMPGLQGDAVAASIRQDPGLSGVEIVFLTASETREMLAEHHKLIQGSPVFAKPVNIDEVIDLIESRI
jgi:CheY-like chemotaxis protein